MRNFHEEYAEHHQPLSAPPDKIFGWTLSGILFVIGAIKCVLWSPWIGGFFLLAAATIAGLTFIAHPFLAKIKAGFMKIAPVIARFLNPVFMGILYVLCFIPGGYIMRLLKHDPLKRAFEPYAPTYWQKREKHDLPNPMKYQF